MLRLCEGWGILTAGAVASNLLAQIDDANSRDEDEGAIGLIGASLDLLIDTWPRGDGRMLEIETVSDVTFRISGVYYVYLRPNDDKALGECLDLAQCATVTAIVPRREESLKRGILEGVLGDRAPNIWSFDAFISWRITSAAIDQRWEYERALLELITRYNRRVAAAGRRDLMVDGVSSDS